MHKTGQGGADSGDGGLGHDSVQRRLEFGLYDQLMIELRREDQRSSDEN